MVENPIIQARKKLFSMIVDQSPVSVDKIEKYRKENELWLGLGIDVVKFLRSRQVLGVLKVDFEKNLVEVNE
jgi:hypothetical protein